MISRTLSPLLLAVGLAAPAIGLPLAVNSVPAALAASAVAQDFKVLDTRNPSDRHGGPNAADLHITMEYQGGNIADYVQAIVEPLRNVLHINVVIDPAADNIRLSPVQVKELPLDKCFELIPQLRLHASDPEPTIAIDREATGANSLLVRVSALVDPVKTETQVQVFSIARALAGLDAEDARKRFESAVEATLRLLDDREPRRPSVRARVSIHQESGTLVVLGTQDQLGAIHQLVDRMSGERMIMDDLEQRRRTAEADQTYARGLAQIELDEASARLEFDRGLFEELEQSVKAGNERSSSLAEPRLRLRLSELEVQKAKAKLESVELRGRSPEGQPAAVIDLSKLQRVPRESAGNISLPSDLVPSAPTRSASSLPPELLRDLQSEFQKQAALSNSPSDFHKQVSPLEEQVQVSHFRKQFASLEEQVQVSQTQIKLLMEELRQSRQVIESLQAELAKRKPQ